MLTYPTKSDYQIAQELNLTSSVYSARLKLITAIDYEFVKKVAGKFLTEFQMA
jgi:hypothetical protein